MYISVWESPTYHLKYQVLFNQLTIQRRFRTVRETIYNDNIRDIKPLSGDIEMDGIMFDGRKPRKCVWGSSGKNIVFGIYRHGKVLTFPITSRAKVTMQSYITKYTKSGSLYYADDCFFYALLPVRGNHIVE